MRTGISGGAEEAVAVAGDVIAGVDPPSLGIGTKTEDIAIDSGSRAYSRR